MQQGRMHAKTKKETMKKIRILQKMQKMQTNWNPGSNPTIACGWCTVRSRNKSVTEPQNWG